MNGWTMTMGEFSKYGDVMQRILQKNLPFFAKVAQFFVCGQPREFGDVDRLSKKTWVCHALNPIGIIVSKGNHPQMALIQVSELL